MTKWTYGKLRREGVTLTAYCHNPKCHHRQTLDIAQLEARYGEDAPADYDDIAPKLTCRRCGGREVGLAYSDPKKPAGNAYAKAKGL